jgi:hypothetical protein
MGVLCLCISYPLAAAAEEPLAGEYQVKAAFLYNVMKFVQWPTSPTQDPRAPWLFCVAGEDPFNGLLDVAIAERSVQGRTIEIKRFERTVEIPELVACHVLFLGAPEVDHAASLLGALASAPVLTIAEREGFASSGGIVELLVFERKLAFVVNQKTAEAHQLKISSQLLKLARRVYR